MYRDYGSRVSTVQWWVVPPTQSVRGRRSSSELNYPDQLSPLKIMESELIRPKSLIRTHFNEIKSECT